MMNTQQDRAPKRFATGPLLIWLGCFAAAQAALAGGYHALLTHAPRLTTVVVDTSYPMSNDWSSLV